MRGLEFKHRIGCPTALTLVLLLGARLLGAQTGSPGMATAMRSDSVAWQRVLVYVVGRLSPELVSAAADTGAQPWELRLLATEPQRQLLEARLRTILRARAIRPADSVSWRLDIGELRVLNDTASVAVRFEETRRCPGGTRTTGFGWTDTVRVVRHPQLKFWGAAFSRATLAGDRVGC